MKSKIPEERSYGGIVLLVIFLLIILLFFSPWRVFSPGFEPLPHISFALISALVVIIVLQVFRTFFRGSFLKTLTSSLLRLALGVFLFFLFWYSGIEVLQNVAFPMLFILVILSGYRIVAHFSHKNYLSGILTKSLVLVGLGVLFWYMFSGIFPRSQVVISEIEEFSMMNVGGIFLRVILPSGFLVSGVSYPFFALSNVKLGSLKIVGNWFRSNIFWISIAGALIWTYFYSVRGFLSEIIGSFLFILEWIIIVLFFVYVGLKFRGAVKKRSEEERSESWREHVQEVTVSRDERQDEVARFVEEFIEEGRRENLVPYLVSLAEKKDFSNARISEIFGEIVNYREPEVPELVLSKELEKWKEDRMEERKEIVENILEKLR